MAEADQVATQSGATTEGEVESAAVKEARNNAHADRSDAMERIAASRRDAFAKDEGVEIGEPAKAADPEPAKVEEPAAAATDDTSDTQIGRQLESGQVLLDEETLSRAVVLTKVDGREELVPASKALGSYQKGAAADVRLAEATRMSREATDLLAKAKAAADATTAAPAVATPSAPSEDEKQLVQEHADALYAGDNEKAGELLGKIIDLRVAKATQGLGAKSAEHPNVDDLVERASTALEQRQSVNGALTKLKDDYPEIWADPDMTLLADAKRASFEAQGKTRAEAIALAGEEVGKKYKLGKHKNSDVGSSGGSTTLNQKLAAKQGLDEPAAAAARAVTTVTPPQTYSQIIAEMQSARQPQAA